jgi:hypothetical protein
MEGGEEAGAGGREITCLPPRDEMKSEPLGGTLRATQRYQLIVFKQVNGFFVFCPRLLNSFCILHRVTSIRYSTLQIRLAVNLHETSMD